MLAEDEAAVQGDPARRSPLAIRANAGEHCLDVTVSNAVPDNANHPFSKISAHIHFMQFDVQTSDGVDTGFNFEQTVRPFTAEGTPITGAAIPGGTSIIVGDADRFSVGAFIGVGMEDGAEFEIRRIDAIDSGGAILLDRALERPHPAGAIVSTEFVRHRWYPDVQVGTAYFHDHVNGIRTWQHGLVGAVVVEPPGATYHDPTTGAETSSGALVDVHVSGDTPVSADISGSFREFVAFIQEPSRLTNVDRSPGTNLNLRAEPLDRRDGPVERLFSSTVHGDPATPLVRAYVGDPVVVRATVGGTNEVHTWHLDGHWFRDEPWSQQSRPISTTHLGISERKDMSIPAAGGPQQRAGDYLYSDGRALKLQEGAWGLLRVLEGPTDDSLAALPGHDPPVDPPPPICPPTAPRRAYAVTAVELALPMLGAEPGRAFVEASQLDAVVSGGRTPTPLVLRAAVGDCIEVTLHNQLPAGASPVVTARRRTGIRPSGLGRRRSREQPPTGGRRRVNSDLHVLRPSRVRDGRGDAARWRRPRALRVTRPVRGRSRLPPKGRRSTTRRHGRPSCAHADGDAWRDVVLFMHDADDAIGTHRMPYTSAVRGAVGLNYGRGETGPVIDAYAGDPLRLHVLAPWSEQVQTFSLEGHRWPVEPAMDGSTHVSSIAIGGLGVITVVPEGGAGGETPCRAPTNSATTASPTAKPG